MKKIFAFALALCMPIVALSACGVSDEIWQETRGQIETVLGTETTPKNTDLFGDDAILYSANIQQQIDTNADFAELKDYETLLKNSFYITQRYYRNLDVISKDFDRDAVKDAHQSLNEAVKSLYSEISAYRKAKREFEASLVDIADFSTLNVQQKLKEYKREFSNLILSASNINVKFINTYVATYEIDTREEVDFKFVLARTSAVMLDEYVKFSLGEYDGQYKKIEPLYNAIIEIKELSASEGYILANLDAWKNAFTKYVAEAKLYEVSLDKIDYPNYKEETSTLEQKAYKNKIDEFLNTYSSYLAEKTKALVDSAVTPEE